MNCWYCDKPIVPPVEIVGRLIAGETVRIHKRCLRVLGELELDFERGDDKPGHDPAGPGAA